MPRPTGSFQRSAPKPQDSYQPKKHSSGPSPLLKGLLDKLTAEEAQDSKKAEPEPEAVPVKAPTPAPISLSALKRKDAAASTSSPTPNKEASDENKASLKDLLARVTQAQPVKEELPLQKIEIKDEVPQPPKQPEPTTVAWHKRTADKEVPEAILRKVLE
jgi:hypothetical protein